MRQESSDGAAMAETLFSWSGKDAAAAAATSWKEQIRKGSILMETMEWLKRPRRSKKLSVANQISSVLYSWKVQCMSVSLVAIPIELLNLPHLLRSLPYRPLELRLWSRLAPPSRASDCSLGKVLGWMVMIGVGVWVPQVRDNQRKGYENVLWCQEEQKTCPFYLVSICLGCIIVAYKHKQPCVIVDRNWNSGNDSSRRWPKAILACKCYCNEGGVWKSIIFREVFKGGGHPCEDSKEV
ncbi:hypothetical protein V8G54_035741 [Vigna mungo]|uniref:Uncharacterized protein n=1 Tax=Vigna mungo TaxID=3915 RepID=A0AAQ3MFV7_VIGMU